jgi:type II secretory pathway pseudopilin PulG
MLQRGFTLVEALVGILLSGATLLVIFTLAFEFYKSYTEISNRIETEKSITMAISQLQRTLSLAVNVDPVTTSLDGVSVGLASTGKILDYATGNVMGATPGKVDTVALFVREKGGHQTPPASEFGPVGIFYARPTPRTSGVLFINVDSSGSAMVPSYSNIFFEHIVEFTMTNFHRSPGATPADQRLTSVEVSLTMRKFISSDTKTWNFCPPTDIANAVAGCTGIVGSYKDITRVMRIALSNQIVADTSPRDKTAASPFERVFGSIYLFPSR